LSLPTSCRRSSPWSVVLLHDDRVQDFGAGYLFLEDLRDGHAVLDV